MKVVQGHSRTPILVRIENLPISQ